MTVDLATAGPAAPGPAPAPAAWFGRLGARGLVALAGWTIAGIAVLVVALQTDGFATWANTKAIFLAASFVGLLALAQTLVMISGSFFSLSLGTTSVLAAMVFLSTLHHGLIVAFALALLAAAVISGVQGLAIGAWRANPIIVTIGANAILTGAILMTNDGAIIRPHAGAPDVDWLRNPIGGIAFPFIVLVVLTVVTHLVLRRTRFGVSAFLVGENPDAARSAALPVEAITVAVFVAAGLLAGTAGILLGASQGGATISTQGTLPFDAIVATLVGGCAVAGGRGSAVGTLLGTLGVAALSSALLLNDLSEGVQILVKGGVLMIVIVGLHLWNTRGTR
jgi:ribose/xylose/arabinose/galactoside ABC-type transport system permease subunit